MRTKRMTRKLCWIFLVLALTAFAQKKGKPPEVELMEAKVHRQEGNLIIDARVKNVGEKPIKTLVLIIDFVASDHKQVITTKRGGLDQEILDPGEEAEFHAQIEDPSRATEFRITVEDGGGKYLRAEKTGPFPIE
jgi:hypothetical protein